MGLPWLKVSSDLPNHPKSLDLAAELGEPRAWTYVLELWLWCGRSAPDGRIAGKHPVAMVERAAGWTGEPGALAGALERVGLLDRAGEAFQVHDWAEHNAAHQAKLERDRAHAAKRRKESRTVSEESQRVASDSSASRPQVAGEIEREIENKKEASLPAPAGAALPAEPSGPEPATTLASPAASSEAPKPRKERRPSRQEATWADLQAMRTEALGLDPEPPPGHARLNREVGDALAQLADVGLRRAWAEYLADPWAQKLDPPCPWRAFTATKRAECLSRADKRRPAANATPAEGCAACGGESWAALKGNFHGGPACRGCVGDFGAEYLAEHVGEDQWAHYQPPAAEAWRAWCARRRAA